MDIKKAYKVVRREQRDNKLYSSDAFVVSRSYDLRKAIEYIPGEFVSAPIYGKNQSYLFCFSELSEARDYVSQYPHDKEIWECDVKDFYIGYSNLDFTDESLISLWKDKNNFLKPKYFSFKTLFAKEIKLTKKIK